MEKNNLYPPAPKGWLAERCRVRFGKILSNISVLCMLLCFLAAASFLLVAVVLLCGFVVIIGTLGTIFAIVPDFWGKFTGSLDDVTVYASALTAAWPYAAAIGLACAAAAIALFATDKTDRHVGRIVLCGAAAAAIFVLIFVLAEVFQV